MFTDVNQTEQIPAAQANIYWPQSIIKFYEERLEWISTVHFGQPIPTDESNNIDDSGRPESVLCTLFFHSRVLKSRILPQISKSA